MAHPSYILNGNSYAIRVLHQQQICGTSVPLFSTLNIASCLVFCPHLSGGVA